MSNYEAKNIVTLDFRDAVRTKLGMYLSADLNEAQLLGLRELIYNAQDEYEVGFGNVIRIQINKDKNIITIEDNARGIPCGLRADGVNSLTAACTMAHTGGKHAEGAYSGAVGINGIGLKVVCLTASKMEVTVYRESNIYTQYFEEGIAKTEVKVRESNSSKTGTCIRYIPSKEIYKENKIDIPALKEILQELSYFTKGLEFILEVNDDAEKVLECIRYKSINGLADALDKKERIHDNILAYTSVVEDVKVELALQWTKDNGEIKSYANNLWVRDGGAFMTGFKTSLTRAFNNIAGTDFSGETIRKYLDGFISVKVRVPQFSNQAKTALANPEARTATSKAITDALNIFSKKYSEDFDKIVERLLKEVKAENAADRARNAVLEAQMKIRNSKKEIVKAPGKLLDCEIHDENSMLFIVEGDSAKGSIGQARDYKHVAVLPLRGKVINALKNSEEDVLGNDIIIDLLKAMGCGILDKFNEKDLNYGKICIYTDADVDGASIMCLLLTFFYVYMPEIIQKGYVYWARAPLYVVKSAGKTIGYAYDDKEKDELIKGKSSIEIKRCKGIGEMSADDVHNTILNEEKARFIKFNMDNYEESIKMFEMLMGSKVDARREYIFDNVDFDELEE